MKKNELSEYSKSRKWLITINNPEESDDTIKFRLSSLKAVTYFCFSREVGIKESTPHLHIFIYAKNSVRFLTLKKLFPTAHLDICNGTSEQNRDYVFKQGEKWGNSEKKTTNLKETHFEYGELPIEKQGKRNDLDTLYNYIKEGKTNFEIIELNSNFLPKLDLIDKVRKLYVEEQYAEVFRNVDVTYIYGESGTGKTRGVMEQYGYRNVFRVNGYKHPFDSYKQQKILLLDEFRSSLQLTDILNILDGYPAELDCRFNNKIGVFDKIYIISNISLLDQYPNIQKEEKDSYIGFLRRIQHVKIYKNNKIEEFNNINDYLISQKSSLRVPEKKDNKILNINNNPDNKDFYEVQEELPFKS